MVLFVSVRLPPGVTLPAITQSPPPFMVEGSLIEGARPFRTVRPSTAKLTGVLAKSRRVWVLGATVPVASRIVLAALTILEAQLAVYPPSIVRFSLPE